MSLSLFGFFYQVSQGGQLLNHSLGNILIQTRKIAQVVL